MSPTRIAAIFSALTIVGVVFLPAAVRAGTVSTVSTDLPPGTSTDLTINTQWGDGAAAGSTSAMVRTNGGTPTINSTLTPLGLGSSASSFELAALGTGDAVQSVHWADGNSLIAGSGDSGISHAISPSQSENSFTADEQVTPAANVPEPSSVILMAFGLVGFGMCGWGLRPRNEQR